MPAAPRRPRGSRTSPRLRPMESPMPRSDAPGHGPANRLLAALPSREYGRLAPHLEPVPLRFRAVLREPGEPISHVYFPSGGVVSQLLILDGKGGVEVGLVGREGMVGLSR